MLLFSRLHDVHAVFNKTGSQSEGSSQCISYNSHTLLIHPLKFISFQWDSLWRPSLPLSQEGHGDTRVPGTDAQWFPLMHLHSQKPYQSRHHGYKQESPAITLALSHPPSFFFSISNRYCKSLEGMRGEIKIERTTGDKGEKEKNEHKWEGGKPSWSTFATGSQWSHPVFLWGCVWTKRSLKSGSGTVLRNHYGHY